MEEFGLVVALRAAAAPRTRRFVPPASVSVADSAEAAMEGDGETEEEDEDEDDEDEDEEEEAPAAACTVCDGDNDMERTLSVASLTTDGDFFGVCARLLMLLLRDPLADRADDDDGSAVRPASLTISMVIPLVALRRDEEERDEDEDDAVETGTCPEDGETTRRCCC